MKEYERLFENLESLKIKGVAKKTLEKLNRLKIYTLYDLLYYFPKYYEKQITNKDLTKLLDGEQVTLEGIIDDISTRYINGKIMIVSKFYNQTGIIELIWFNNRYIMYNLKNKNKLKITGKVKRTSKIQIINPHYTKIREISNGNISETNKPVYSLTSGLKQENLKKIIENAIDKYGYLLQENIPLELVQKYNFLSRKEAITLLHNPSSQQKLNESYKRILYEEIVILEMYILYNKYINNVENNKGYIIQNNMEMTKKYIKSLDFELTVDQKKVVKKIFDEIKSGKNINRLIQGDVGSGKTVVSVICMLHLVENGYQAAIMTPTEVLSYQHYENIKKELEKIGFEDVVFLSSSVKGKKRKEILEKIKNNEAKIIVGTHSLIQDNVEFNNLGIIVIDEQHRFGVHQREKLREKSVLKNIIVMSATPIPRSLALTIYGDLDISSIRHMPSNRKKVKTKWIKNKDEQEKMYNFINSKLEEKMQVYVVSPRVFMDDKSTLKSAEETFLEYKKQFSNYKVELLHGKQNSKQKTEILEKFELGEIDILVSTTVIEVGINVVNANIMVIRNANRFGLSTLHQLRGRVGRGDKQAYCFLEEISDDLEEILSNKRLEILEKTTDGFEISEKDLELRKSGEIFGEKQSGISDLVFVDLVKHLKEIEEIRDYITNYLDKTKGEIENPYLILDIKNKQRLNEKIDE